MPSYSAYENGSSPIKIFDLIMPTDTLWKEAVVHMNSMREKFLAQLQQATSDRHDLKWYSVPITVAEIKVLIGLQIIHVLYPIQGGMKLHWSQAKVPVAALTSFGEYMAHDRYEVIMRCWTFVQVMDDKQAFAARQRDRFWKIRPLCNALKKTFKDAYVPGTYLSHDEGCIETFSKWCPCKQKILGKPMKSFVKLFMTCCVNGYCHQFDVYQGKGDDDFSGLNSILKHARLYENSWRCFIFDRYYAHIRTFIGLRKLGLSAVGTMRSDRIGFPKFIDFKDSDKVERGTLNIAETNLPNDMGKLVAMVWQDTVPVRFMSCGVRTVPISIEKLGKDGRVHKHRGTEVQKIYQTQMGGVDTNDYVRVLHFSLQKRLRLRRWYKALSYGLIDLALTNCYILSNEMNQDRIQTHFEFLSDLATSLLSYADIEKPKASTPILGTHEHRLRTSSTKKKRSENAFAHLTNHKFVKLLSGDDFEEDAKDKDGNPLMYGYQSKDKTARDCLVCRTSHGHVHSTQYYCSTCQAAVCVGVMELDTKNQTARNCWIQLHTDRNVYHRVQEAVKRSKKSHRTKALRLGLLHE